MPLNRKCPNCCEESVSVSALILSDTFCPSCGQLVGVQWVFKATFFLIILVATAAVGVLVLVDQGLYAAILMVSLPIGAIGFIKARYCPLVVRKQKPDTTRASS
jgi:hypothetical protein